MYIQDELVKIYFRYVSSHMILNGNIDYKCFPQHIFEELMFCYMKEYSETEIKLLYQSMRDTVGYESENYLNVFQILENVAIKMLVFRDNQIKCRYSELHRWRKLTRYIGEDLLVCAFLVHQKRESGREWQYFQWNTILGHTNKQLNAILNQGVSENHFHLFGSAPVFQLIWLKLMNTVNINNYIKELAGIDQKRRNHNYYFDISYKEDNMCCMVLQAALIRLLLFCYINNKFFWKKYLDKFSLLLSYLEKGNYILDMQKEIRELINLLKADVALKKENNLLDYALFDEEQNSLNWIFAGERKLIYELLFELLVKKTLPHEYASLLYAYLVIKATIRAEIVQNNENVGFENFAVYNRRKGGFLKDKNDYQLMVKHAVHSSFNQSNIQSLEIRITPCGSYLENAKQIKEYDKIISSQGKISKDKFYYVYHFPKKQDSFKGFLQEGQVICRDAKLRKEVQYKGMQIIEFQKRMPQEACRVKGIDACAQEIGCRPEVFAPTFRALKQNIVSLFDDTPVRQLKQTYHVGEDFLDVVDGLRAVDEAIHFLNMRNGDRLGHATVLGIDVRKWYEVKHCTIFIKAQDYLDNVVWLYNKIIEFQLEGCEILKNYLLQQFELYYKQIYQAGNKEVGRVSIYTYYAAWKLRGDAPQRYKDKTYLEEDEYFQNYAEINREFPEDSNVRKNVEIVELYWKYHYDEIVRNQGRRPMEVKIPKIYVEGAQKVQEKMQMLIRRKGICIETNPSSNLLISTMAGYEEHPILNLYNLGLTVKVNECPQLNVSINTDDKGVFNTSLENEYALLASALENMRDEAGEFRYNSQEIYEWINHLRIMGNHQTFMEIKDKGGEEHGLVN